MYSTINSQTELLHSELCTPTGQFSTWFMVMLSNLRSVDCGLFAIAYITDIVFPIIPCLYAERNETAFLQMYRAMESVVSGFKDNVSTQNLFWAPRSVFVNTVSSCHLYPVYIVIAIFTRARKRAG